MSDIAIWVAQKIGRPVVIALFFGWAWWSLGWSRTKAVFADPYKWKSKLVTTGLASTVGLLVGLLWVAFQPRGLHRSPTPSVTQTINANPTNQFNPNVVFQNNLLPVPSPDIFDFKLEILDEYFARKDASVELYIYGRVTNTGVRSITRDYVARVSVPSVSIERDLIPSDIDRRPTFDDETEQHFKAFKIDSTTPLDVQTSQPIEHNDQKAGWLRFTGMPNADLDALNNNGGVLAVRMRDARGNHYDSRMPQKPKFCEVNSCDRCASIFHAPGLH